MRLGINAHHHINITIRAEIFAQDRPKYGELGNTPAFTEFCNLFAGKIEFLSSHALNYSTLENHSNVVKIPTPSNFVPRSSSRPSRVPSRTSRHTVSTAPATASGRPNPGATLLP